MTPVTCLPELCSPSTPNTGIGSKVQTDIETENMPDLWLEAAYPHTLLQPEMFSFPGLGTPSRALGWHSGDLSVTEFQQRIQESSGLNFFCFCCSRHRTTHELSGEMGGSLIPHQTSGHLASSFSAQSPLPAAGFAPWMEKIRNDWVPVKQAQLSGSEVGWGRALTAK